MVTRARLSWLFAIACLVLAAAAAANEADLAVAKAMQQSYDRRTSKVMVRVLHRTDRAALDYAAYDQNPILHYRMAASPRPPDGAPKLAELHFGGALVAGTVCDRLADTPLTKQELQRPMAWRPLLKYLCEWNYDAAEGLLVAGSRVSGEKWGNDDLVRPLQEIASAYVHGDELWGKVEFRPELSWLPVTDEDKDGYGEVYARVDPASYGVEVLRQIRHDYLSKELAGDELEQFFFELASDWYQELRTEILEPETARPWPNADTEPEILKAFGEKSFANPLAVMRGRPSEEALYNVFLLAGGANGNGSDEGGEAPDALAAFHEDVRRQLDVRPTALKGLIGQDGFLFFRGDVEYLVSGDLRKQENGRDPYPAIVDFQQQLEARGIELLMAFIPSKAEVYPEKLSAHAPAGAKPYVAPYGRKLLAELAEAGVEAVDLLPAFVEERAPNPELLYMPLDTHWTHRGVRLAAKLIAKRVRQYPWYAELAKQPVKYSFRDVTCTRQGDICTMLTDQERLKYRPMKLEAQQVVAPDGSLYQDDPESPIVMLGDSFTGVFHFEDCRHAGLSAHLAKELGLPIDLIMAQGSGPRIRGRLARRGHDAINAKRLVIWTVAARDLYNYWAPWDIIRLP